MCQVIEPHQAGSQVRLIVEGDARFSVIRRLRQAYQYAEEVGCSYWEFAVTIGELRRDGVGENDLRWLVRRGYLEHADEVIAKLSNEREFEHRVSLRFTKRTAFIMTEAGARIASQLLDGLPGHPGDAKVVGELVGATPRPVASIIEQSNGNVITAIFPSWDRDRRELRFSGELVKVFKLPSPMQEAILMAFEEEGWPPRIDDPLPVHPDLIPKRRLHDTIKCLNRNQKCNLIRFMGDGTGEGVRWERVSGEG